MQNTPHGKDVDRIWVMSFLVISYRDHDFGGPVAMGSMTGLGSCAAVADLFCGSEICHFPVIILIAEQN